MDNKKLMTLGVVAMVLVVLIATALIYVKPSSGNGTLDSLASNFSSALNSSPAMDYNLTSIEGLAQSP
jgi:hypothetical protein